MAKKAKRNTSTTGRSRTVSQRIGAAATKRKLRWYYRVKLGNRWVWFPKRDWHIRGY
jgi:hypothetical protein